MLFILGMSDVNDVCDNAQDFTDCKKIMFSTIINTGHSSGGNDQNPTETSTETPTEKSEEKPDQKL